MFLWCFGSHWYAILIVKTKFVDDKFIWKRNFLKLVCIFPLNSEVYFDYYLAWIAIIAIFSYFCLLKKHDFQWFLLNEMEHPEKVVKMNRKYQNDEKMFECIPKNNFVIPTIVFKKTFLLVLEQTNWFLAKFAVCMKRFIANYTWVRFEFA